MNKYKARSNKARSITYCKSHQIYAFINSYLLQQLYLKQQGTKYTLNSKKCKIFHAEGQIKEWNIKDTFIGVIWNKTEVFSKRDDFCLWFSTLLSYPWGYIILVSTACLLWKKNIIYVGNVYNKNIKIITLIIVSPGSTRVEAM